MLNSFFILSGNTFGNGAALGPIKMGVPDRKKLTEAFTDAITRRNVKVFRKYICVIIPFRRGLEYCLIRYSLIVVSLRS